MRYDATNTSTPSKRRNVYAASGTQDFTIIEEPNETQFSQRIDTPSEDFYQVHQAKQQKAFKTTIWVPEGSCQKDNPLWTQEAF